MKTIYWYKCLLKSQRNWGLGRWFSQVKEREGTSCISARTRVQIPRRHVNISVLKCLPAMLLHRRQRWRFPEKAALLSELKCQVPGSVSYISCLYKSASRINHVPLHTCAYLVYSYAKHKHTHTRTCIHTCMYTTHVHPLKKQNKM